MKIAQSYCWKIKMINYTLLQLAHKGKDLNGYETTRQIRQFNKVVIIIAQTAFGLSGDREKSLEAGCNDYISKPINQNQLLELIQKYFNNHKK